MRGTPAPKRLVEAESMEVPLDEQVYMLDALQEEFRKRGYVPYTRSRIWQLEQIGAFPARVRLGSEKYSRIGWLRVEVDAWFKEKLQNRLTWFRVVCLLRAFLALRVSAATN